MPVTVYDAVGCSSCAQTGFRGRIGLHEVMPMTEALERLASTHASSDEIRRVAIEQGMTTLRQDGWNKVALGVTTMTEVMRVTTT